MATHVEQIARRKTKQRPGLKGGGELGDVIHGAIGRQ